METKKVICIIPARGGSKGVPRKNLRKILGEPLVSYTIKAALNSGVVDRVFVSTEDEEIAKVAKEYGAEVINRPLELAGDKVTLEPVIHDALSQLKEIEGYVPELVSLIQPTSPLLKPETIRESVTAVLRGDFDSCITAFNPETYEWKWLVKKDENTGAYNYVPEAPVLSRVVRQDLPKILHENGAFYVTSHDLFMANNHRWGGKVGVIEMTQEDSIQIDSEFQLWLIEQLLKKRSELE